MQQDRWTVPGRAPDAELIAIATAVPKCELHCHLEGSIRASTAAELAARHGIDLGVPDPDNLYAYDDLAGFLKALGVVNSVLLEAADFERVVHEATEDGVRAGVRHREMFFTPGYHVVRGVSLDVLWEGIVAGIAAAETDFGVTCRMVIDIRRSLGVAHAKEVAAWAAEQRSEYLVAMGADDVESTIDHSIFIDAFAAAKAAGLHRCLHAGEEGPVDTIRFGVERLGIERIDHGMRLFDDPELARRVIAERIPITACPTSNVQIGICPDIPSHPVGRQLKEGALVTVNADDPAAFQIDVATEFAAVVAGHGLGVEGLRMLSLNSVEASFLDAPDKARLRAKFSAECERILEPPSA